MFSKKKAHRKQSILCLWWHTISLIFLWPFLWHTLWLFKTYYTMAFKNHEAGGYDNIYSAHVFISESEDMYILKFKL